MKYISEERLREIKNTAPDGKSKLFVQCSIVMCKELNPWQTIDSAPIQKRLLLIRKSDNDYVLAKIYNESDRRFYTHWMERPELPK